MRPLNKGRCVDCRYVEELIAPVEGRQFGHYACHRYPPTDVPQQNAFPKVAGDWWCGEFRPAQTGVTINIQPSS